MGFFRAVLPSRGVYAAAYGKYDTTWLTQPEDFEAPIRLCSEDDSYFVASSFTSGFSAEAKRDSDNALLRRAFVLDIDVRSQPGFFDTEVAALQAVLDAASSGAVPTPSFIVRTGGGFHVYWIGKDYSMPQWEERNRAFTGYLSANLPPELTADITTSKRGPGLYRIPGTLNRKYSPPRKVQIVTASGLTHEDWIEGLPSHSGGSAVQVVPVAMAWDFPRPSYVVRTTVGDITEGLEEPREYSHESAYEGCAQYRWLYDLGPTHLNQGQTYTPWWDMSIIMRRFPDGPQRYDEWSSRFPGYNPDEAYRKISEDSKRVITCGRFSEDIGDPGRSRCVGCRFFRDSSPGSPMTAAEVRPEVDMTPRVAPPVESLDGDFTRIEPEVALPDFLALLPDGSGPKMPGSPYLVNFDPAQFGVYRKGKVEKDKNGNIVNRPQRLLSSKPIFLVARGVEEAGKDENRKRKLDLWAAMGHDGRVALRYLPSDVWQEAKTFRKVADETRLAVIREGGAGLNEYLSFAVDFFDRFHNHEMMIHRQMGWSETHDGFVIDDRLYVGERKFRPTAVSYDAGFGALGVKGTLAEQLRALRHYEHKDVSDTARAMLAFAAGAPLLDLCFGNTIMIHAYSTSGGGKTSMQKVCASLFGKPTIHASGKDTANSGERVIATMRNLPVMYDELETENSGSKRGATNAMTAAFIRALSNDHERMRGSMGANGGDYQVRAPLNYCTHVIASSNLRLDQLLPGAGDDIEAAKARVLHLDNGHLPLTPKSHEWQGRYDDINHTLDRNYGHIGALLIDYLIQNRDAAIARVFALRDKLTAVAKDPHKDRMKILSTACAMVAGEIMQSQGWFMTSSLWTKKAVDRLRKGDQQPAAPAPVTPQSKTAPVTIGTVPAPQGPAQAPLPMSANAMFTDILGQNYGAFVRVQGGASPMALGPPISSSAYFGVVVTNPDGSSTIYLRSAQFSRYCVMQSRISGTQIDPDHLVRQWSAQDSNFSAYEVHSFPDVARAQDFPNETYHVYRRAT